MATRMKEKYLAEAVPALQQKFGYKNVNEIPRLEKIVINMGLGECKDNAKALEMAGLTIDDISVIELNEAFAAQALGCIKMLGWEDKMDIINPNGSGISLGHPIGCTGCRYCVDGCPAGIPIPDLFAAFNEYRQEKRTDTEGFEKAAECVECGQCEDICPQHLSIRELLKEVASTAK